MEKAPEEIRKQIILEIFGFTNKFISDREADQILALIKEAGYVKLADERVRQEIKRVRREIAHDLKEYELRYSKATGETLSKVMTE